MLHTLRPDTIFAVASGSGRSAVAIVRISGPHAYFVCANCLAAELVPRVATLVDFRDDKTGEVLDRALAIWFPAPRSFTGQDCLELHLHGGTAVVTSVFGVLSHLPDFRLAQPGEFTRRAFENGKMDLAAVEGMSDLIDAETDAQRRQAMRQMSGAVGTQVRFWSEIIRKGQCLIEAEIDFSDQDDVSVSCLAQVQQLLVPVGTGIERAMSGGSRGEIIRNGFNVVIAGLPNTGKSTLLNALTGRDAAIVSPMAGTTRDLIEVRLELDGLPVVMVDTAGIRETSEPVETEGIRRALERAKRSDLILWLFESKSEDAIGPQFEIPVVQVATKIDKFGFDPRADICVSALTRDGLDQLLAIVKCRADIALVGSEDDLISRERHLIELRQCGAAIDRILSSGDKSPIEFIAEDFRLANSALERLVGKVTSEAVLGEIFARFCIGK